LLPQARSYAVQLDADFHLCLQGAIQEFFLGSVTRYATHHCTQPVLVLH
jgi:hypothetical protein